MPQAAPMLKQTSNSGSLSEFRDCQTCVARPGSALCAYRGGGAFACESLSSQGTSLNSKFLPFRSSRPEPAQAMHTNARAFQARVKDRLRCRVAAARILLCLDEIIAIDHVNEDELRHPYRLPRGSSGADPSPSPKPVTEYKAVQRGLRLRM